eukprot:scaffold246435_cov17-Tisochrysis_lutea.AAC.1
MTIFGLCCEALSKCGYGSFLAAMDACFRDELQEQGIEVLGNISRGIPDWVFPTGNGSSARHRSRPDA